jgi:hypothetical protein
MGPEKSQELPGPVLLHHRPQWASLCHPLLL